MARGYYGRSGDDGMDIARNAMDLSEGLGGLLEKGQQIERGRRELADDAGIRRAYDHIASRVGQGGDISALDGDPVMNSRYGVMAMADSWLTGLAVNGRVFRCSKTWQRRTIRCISKFSDLWP